MRPFRRNSMMAEDARIGAVLRGDAKGPLVELSIPHRVLLRQVGRHGKFRLLRFSGTTRGHLEFRDNDNQ